ncbi:MAG: hypothetical protein ACREIS_08215 [Nitrospiraceae bacterium]
MTPERKKELRAENSLSFEGQPGTCYASVLHEVLDALDAADEEIARLREEVGWQRDEMIHRVRAGVRAGRSEGSRR